jgi:hypothetical protein
MGIIQGGPGGGASVTIRTLSTNLSDSTDNTVWRYPPTLLLAVSAM